MGQRLLQLNNTFTVADNGQITLHVAQLPPNPNLVQPGPVFVYVVIHGIPSNGTRAIVGNGQIGSQPASGASVLPTSVLSSNNAAGSASSSGTNAKGGSHSSGPSTGVIVAAAVGGIAAVAIAGAFAGVLIARKRRAAAARKTIIGGIARSASMGRAYRDAHGPSESSTAFNEYNRGSGGSGSGDGFIPLHQYSQADLHAPSWTPSQTSLHHGSAMAGGYGDAQGSTPSFDPYDQGQEQGQGQGQGRGHPRYL
jgi:Galactose oxidase-like, Early set domain